jgi:hypothetical protein
MRALECVPTADGFPLSPPAAAILEFTSNVGQRKRPRELTYITSKDAYIWAGVAALITQYASEGRINFTEDVEIYTELYRIIVNTFKSSPPPNRPPYLVPFQEIDIHPRGFRQSLVTFSIITRQWYLTHVGAEIIWLFLRSAAPDISEQDVIIGINVNIAQGYNELRNPHLIIDPIIEATLSLAVLSFIPFSIFDCEAHEKW